MTKEAFAAKFDVFHISDLMNEIKDCDNCDNGINCDDH